MHDANLRGQVYRQLGTLFSPPDLATWQQVLERGCFSPLPDGSEVNIEAGLTFAQLALLYSSSFEVGNAPVSLHERAYIPGEEKKLFEELLRYYEHFGLDMKKNTNEHWPDSLLVELDFLYYLVHLESIASRPEDALSLRKGQHDFLDRHLLPLVTGFAERLRNLNVSPYDQIARLMVGFIARDLSFMARKLAS